ncbi:MAG: methionine--tRNA ligase [Alphaproteobacteria bacterium]
MSDDAYYLTTPIYYVNDTPHVGHAYTTLACDALARFMRLDGRRVKFLTGTDEHGQKVEKSAEAAGQDPKAFVDRMSEHFRELTDAMNFSNDDFIRTTEERHIRSVQQLWRELQKRDQIYLGSYAGWYSVRDEAYYAESELIEGPEGAKTAPTGAPIEWLEEPSYFFKLSEWQKPLLDYYASGGVVGPETRLNEVRSFVEGDLRDLSISRTGFKWGVPVPDDPDHVMYVWLDALTNYLSAVGYPDTECEEYRTFWPVDIHMVGKDILRFHAIYWPAFLMAAGVEPPKRVFAHGWWTNEGQKISKSLGNIIDPFQLIERYGLDPVRYFLLREVPFGKDGDFSHRAMIGRMNSDLANDFGNLVQRVLSMIAKNCEGRVPEMGTLQERDKGLLEKVAELLTNMRGDYRQQRFHAALERHMALVGEANRYVDEQAPWALRKSDPERMRTVLFVLAEVIRNLAILAQPVMPDSAGRILDQLTVGVEKRAFKHVWPEARLAAGTALPAPEPIFPRYAEEEGRESEEAGS